jgi:hypothetical protein
MGAFSSEQFFPTPVDDLAPVARHVAQHFEAQGFQVKTEPSVTRGWLVSISKGNLFTSVMGMQTALNLEIEPMSGGTTAKASVGVFGHQIVPSLISLFVFWPVLLTQIWGLVVQSQLDDEALQAVQMGLLATAGPAAAATPEAVPDGAIPTAVPGERTIFCTNCGTKLPAAVKFCSECGGRQSAA